MSDLWEYKALVHRNAANELNKLGKQGWELVAVVTADHVTIFYLKRKIMRTWKDVMVRDSK